MASSGVRSITEDSYPMSGLSELPAWGQMKIKAKKEITPKILTIKILPSLLMRPISAHSTACQVLFYVRPQRQNSTRGPVEPLETKKASSSLWLRKARPIIRHLAGLIHPAKRVSKTAGEN